VNKRKFKVCRSFIDNNDNDDDDDKGIFFAVDSISTFIFFCKYVREYHLVFTHKTSFLRPVIISLFLRGELDERQKSTDKRFVPNTIIFHTQTI
jgi:hypothetical protein